MRVYYAIEIYLLLNLRRPREVSILISRNLRSQARNHGNVLAATSTMEGRICPPWLG